MLMDQKGGQTGGEAFVYSSEEGQGQYGGYETEQQQDDYNAFNEKTIRHNFIRKVYGILSVQLAITMAFIATFLYVESLQRFSHENPWLWILAFIATMICLIALACCPHVRRSFPSNFIFLGVFTLCEAFLLGMVSSCYDEDAVLIAVGVCAMVVFALTVFSFQTKIDFTMCSGLLFVMLIVLICFGLLCMIFRSFYARLIYACLGAVVFSLYLVFDTQLMMGGKHKYSISPEEYVFASLNLYLDIVNLFLFILQIVGSFRK